jgi:hypothetical protein
VGEEARGVRAVDRAVVGLVAGTGPAVVWVEAAGRPRLPPVVVDVFRAVAVRRARATARREEVRVRRAETKVVRGAGTRRRGVLVVSATASARACVMSACCSPPSRTPAPGQPRKAMTPLSSVSTMVPARIRQVAAPMDAMRPRVARMVRRSSAAAPETLTE